MGRTEEIQYLRETLQRTREKLEQEQRLNSAIKAKKVNLKSIITQIILSGSFFGVPNFMNLSVK